MWYAIQVSTGREEVSKDMCIKFLDKKSYKNIFIIKLDIAKRYYGSWHKEKKILFPGYMFIDTDSPNEIYEQLKNVPEFTKFLGREDKNFISIEPSKEAMFKAIVNKDYEIPMSTGIIEGDSISIIYGPLTGNEAIICKINRHKRTATLNVKMFGESVGVTVGLEVVEKRKVKEE